MDGESLTRMGLTLGLLLGIPGLLLVLLRRFGLRLPGQPDGAGRLGIVSRLPIDAKHSLLLVRRDTHEQLLLLGPTGATILDPAVTLSTSDVAEQKKQARRRRAQVAANRAALQRTRADVVQGVAAVLTGVTRVLRSAAERIRTEPRFHQLVERVTVRRAQPSLPPETPPPVPKPVRKPRVRPSRASRPRRRASAA